MSKHKKYRKRKNRERKTCDDQCENFCYIGDGDAICNKAFPPKTVMEGWAPADNFFWCGGKRK